MIEIMLEEESSIVQGAHLKVIGIGGAGCNVVNWMVKSADLEQVEFIAANTDAQSLELSSAQKKIHLGAKITKGLGAGSDPKLGRRAAEEDINSVIELLNGADILFLTAGLGGGTGTGGLPVIARAAREQGILTIAIVTKPFLFEGKRRLKYAEEAIKDLKKEVDTLLVVPNQRLLEVSDKKISMLDAFALSNDILKQAVKGISDIITKTGHINVDFADVRSIMKEMGMAIMGTGRASGQNRASEAVRAAISSPLLENVNIQGARGVLINITGNENLGLYEINDATTILYDLVREDANIILGSVIDNSVGDEMIVTVIATGFDEEVKQEVVVSPKMYINEDVNKDFFQPKRIEEQLPRVASAAIVEREVLKEPARLDDSRNVIIQKVSHEEKKLANINVERFDENDLDAPTFMRKHANLKDSQVHDLKDTDQIGS